MVKRDGTEFSYRVSRQQILTWACGCFAILLVASSPPMARGQVPPATSGGPMPAAEVPEVLRDIAAMQQANFDAVSSFSGTCRFQVKYNFTAENAALLGVTGDLAGNPPWRRVDQGTVALMYDQKLASTYSDFQVSEARVVRDASGNDLDTILPYKSSDVSVVSDAEYLSFQPTMRYGEFAGFASDVERRGRAAIRAHPDEGRRLRNSNVFYFEDMFSYGVPFWVYLRQLADAAEVLNSEKPASEINTWFSVVRYRTGDSPSDEIVSVSFRLVPSADAPVSDGIRLKIDCSKDFGWNFRECSLSAADGTEQQIHSWEYVKQDGVFIPSRMIRANLEADGNRIATERTLVMEKAAVNEPVASSSFSWRAFGLQDGERLVDRIENVMYVVDGDELVAVDSGVGVGQGVKADVAQPTVAHSAVRFYPLWIGSAMLVVSVCTCFAVRMLRRRQRATTAAPIGGERG